ncbi:hypothetical protein U5922_002450 [Aquicoccus sp. G2-2]|uniref:hypothetical protein n=1 Tax=Aquicoccus sp. G2-2 TaxID=3092120 RepID=UPI002AE037FA|nr:hypothetical protein [Aquicoccus sp. G2-2]MEA1112382.1 hypothetical protein [Aquicoccus sp. G2-2]
MRLLGGLAVLIMLSGAGSAEAAGNCAPHEQVVARLAQSYGEQRQAIGLGADNALVEVFASDASGTWTITVTTAQGLTCLVASGQAFEAFAVAAAAEKGSDT